MAECCGRAPGTLGEDPGWSETMGSACPGRERRPTGVASVSETVIAKVTVAGDDVTNVRLVGTRPTAGTGRIVGDPATLQSLQPATIRLIVATVDFDDAILGGGAVKINDDFLLELRAQL